MYHISRRGEWDAILTKFKAKASRSDDQEGKVHRRGKERGLIWIPGDDPSQTDRWRGDWTDSRRKKRRISRQGEEGKGGAEGIPREQRGSSIARVRGA